MEELDDEITKYIQNKHTYRRNELTHTHTHKQSTCYRNKTIMQ